MTNVVETINYEGFNINIHRDTFAGNPWNEWDGLPPILVCFGRDGEYKSNDFPDIPVFTRQQIKENLPDILRITGCNSLFQLCREWKDFHNWYSVEDTVNDLLFELVDGELNISDRLALMEKVFTMAGVTVLYTIKSDYGQSDESDILIVATPEWQKCAGNNQITIEALEEYAELYAAWAYGDVYGYEINDSDGKELESTWGFYGSDHEESGLLKCARNYIDYARRKFWPVIADKYLNPFILPAACREALINV